MIRGDNNLVDALERFVAAIEAEGMPVSQGLQSGLAPDRVREQLGTLDFQAPEDALMYFGWHNGWSSPEPPWPSFGVGITLPPFARLLEIHSWISEPLELHAEMGSLEHSKWFPIINCDGTFVLMDCLESSTTFGRVFGFDPEIEVPQNRSSRLSDVIVRWSAYIENKQWRRSGWGWTDYRENVTAEDQIAKGGLD